MPNKEIGGYFELESNKGQSYYPELLALNTGRDALEHILRNKEIDKLYVPYYTCDVVLEPLNKLNIRYEFYEINYKLEIKSLPNLNEDEALLYTNYFGLKQDYIIELCNALPNIIIDNSQAFYAKPLEGIDTFYSPRKFFGVPDGAYVTDAGYGVDYEHDLSYSRCNHLLLRVDKGATAGYTAFKENDHGLVGLPIKQMSKLTKHILSGIDYERCREIRNSNFSLLHASLGEKNKLKWIEEATVNGPMVYPYLPTNEVNIKTMLIENNVYVATYWPNVLTWCKKKQVEYDLTNSLVCLPIDQRYNDGDMKIISSLING